MKAVFVKTYPQHFPAVRYVCILRYRFPDILSQYFRLLFPCYDMDRPKKSKRYSYSATRYYHSENMQSL